MTEYTLTCIRDSDMQFRFVVMGAVYFVGDFYFRTIMKITHGYLDRIFKREKK